MEIFIDLISELGKLMDAELIPDLNQVVTIMINEKIMVNIELGSTGEKILLGSFIVELPPGYFRQEVLKFALLANHASDINTGTLGYISNHNCLTLLQEIDLHELTPAKLYEHIIIFVSRAEGWQNAVNSGKLYPEEKNEIPKLNSKKESSKIFGF